MSQFSLFDDLPEPPPAPPVRRPQAQPRDQRPAAATQPDLQVTLKPHIAQPPAIARVSDTFPEHPAGLKPLRVVPDDWIERRITDEELAARRPQFSPACTSEYVELTMLQELGVRTRTSSRDDREPDPSMTYLYEFIDGPFLIRRRTIPGVVVLVWQGPATISSPRSGSCSS